MSNDSDKIIKLNEECNSLARQLNESNERNGRILAENAAMKSDLATLRGELVAALAALVPQREFGLAVAAKTKEAIGRCGTWSEVERSVDLAAIVDQVINQHAKEGA